MTVRYLRSILLASTCLLVSSPLFAASDKCLAVNGIAKKLTSTVVTADYSGSTVAATGVTTFVYTFSGSDGPTAGGIPGLISYCIYPQGANLPTGAITVDSGATGADGELFVASTLAKGSFSYTRAHGDPSNIAMDGKTYTLGTAAWNGACAYDPISGMTSCSSTATDNQTILLHINDPAECARLYGDGSSNTCWVFPTTTIHPPPPPLCNGDPACKSAVIDEATGAFDSNNYPIVPLNTLLHIHYTYVIVNQLTNAYDMTFNVPTAKTQDINAGGGKDYFGCEQEPDPAGSPATYKTVADYQNTGFQLNFFASTGKNCGQSRFQLTAPTSTITITPGYSISFTVDMITRSNNGGKQEYTSAGPHILNSGFTVKWFQSNDAILHSFSTGINPLYVDAQLP